jgi:Icc-related predicted phosphoesterase
MRIFFATDLHGSDVCFRKLLKAREFYNADVILLGGDLCAGAVVFAEEVEGGWKVRLGDRELLLSGQSDMEKLQSSLADRGHILKVLHDTQRPAAQALRQEFEMHLERWVELARNKSARDPIYYVPGNDDPSYMDEILKPPFFFNIHRKHIELDERTSMLGIGGSTPTPWNTEREYSEQELESFVTTAYDNRLSDKSLVLLSHCPPYGTGLDFAPALLDDLTYELHLGAPRFVPVGSHAIRRALDELTPILGLFGHVHEARRHVQVHRTLCINPGSAFWTGRLQGCIVDIIDGKVTDFQLTEG